MSRSLIWGSSLLLAIFTMVATPVQKAIAQPGVSVSFQTFYDALSPHGQWIDDPENGYVWSPRGVGSDFRPYYSGGNWAMTDYGNTWVSDYPWGWAPFHYGRWAYSPFYGWLWVPGTTWGPAWVHWRGGGSNYGWAPMGPGANMYYGGGNGYYAPNDWWTFVPCNRIYQHGGYGRYWRGPRYNNTYINNTTIINNTYINNNNTYVIGPRRSDIERTTGQRVKVYNVRNDNTPGRSRIDGRNLNVYRPEIRQDRAANARPQNVVRAERANRDMNNTVRGAGDANAERNLRSNDQTPALGSSRDRQVETGRMRQQPDVQVQQERNDRDRESRMAQQRDAQMQEERASRERESRMAQQRDMQMQQERANRERESRMAQQQRDMQMQQERASRDRELQAMQQQRDAQAQQRRVQQQRATEQRAQQQQQIESRRQQRYEQQQPQQQRVDDRSSGDQRVQRSQPQQQPTQNVQRSGGENTGRRR